MGNLLLERMMGATIKTVSVQEYQRVGSAALTEQVAEELRSQGRNPYVIPVGGSNTCGTWGYIEGISELEKQLKMGGVGIPSSGTFDHIVFACGSGGTASGIGLGCALSGVGAQTAVHAVGVCDSPEWFYNFIRQDIHPGLGCEAIDPESYLRVILCRGHGYAVSTDEELRLCKDVAASTAVLLDPVYSGKALYAFVRDARADPERFRGKDILFWHTGGGLGMFEKAEQLAPLLSGQATDPSAPTAHTEQEIKRKPDAATRTEQSRNSQDAGCWSHSPRAAACCGCPGGFVMNSLVAHSHRAPQHGGFGSSCAAATPWPCFRSI